MVRFFSMAVQRNLSMVRSEDRESWVDIGGEVREQKAVLGRYMVADRMVGRGSADD